MAHKGMDMYTGNNLEEKYQNSLTTQFSLANRLADLLSITDTLLLSIMVFNRCATLRHVACANSERLLDHCVHGGRGFTRMVRETMLMMNVNSTELKANNKNKERN